MKEKLDQVAPDGVFLGLSIMEWVLIAGSVVAGLVLISFAVKVYTSRRAAKAKTKASSSDPNRPRCLRDDIVEW